MKFPLVSAFVLPLLLLASCAEKPNEDAPKEKETVPENKRRIVGRVASVPADGKFVLIQSYGSWKVETGAVLTTQGSGGRKANLLVTGEKLGQYAAADIRSGTLEVGDGVYTIVTPPKLPGDPEPQETEEAEASPKETTAKALESPS